MNSNDNLKNLFCLIESNDYNGNPIYNSFIQAIEKKKYSCLFGAGSIGKSINESCRMLGLKIDFFCDNDPQKWGENIQETPCLSYDELLKIKSEVVIVISASDFLEIKNQLTCDGFNGVFIGLDTTLLKKGFSLKRFLLENKDRICKVNELLTDNHSRELYYHRLCNIAMGIGMEEFQGYWIYPQYYIPQIKLADNECFVDCGAFIGEAIKEFIRNVNNHFDYVFAFELSKQNFNKLKTNMSYYPENIRSKTSCFNVGVADKNEFVFYQEDDIRTSIKNTGIQGEVVKLDDALANKNISFIKMDVEGYELSALKGARNLITRCIPKLAICVYHLHEDIWEIPLYINSLVPGYRLCLNHHSKWNHDTVCYAIPPTI